MDKRRILVVVLLFAIILIALGAIYLGLKLSQENDVSPKESSAAQSYSPANEFEDANCGANKNPNITISAPYHGSNIEIVTSSRLAGAIDSLKYRGIEMENSWAHGRQIQTALFVNDYGECYNPTEAGNRDDHLEPTSSSVFLDGCQLTSNKLYTKTQMAFWLKPGEVSAGCRRATQAVNTTIVSDYVNSKIVEIGFQGLPNVIRYNNQIHVPENFTSGFAQSVTGNLKYRFDQYYSYDLQTHQLTHYAQEDTDPLSPPWTFIKAFYGIPLLSDGTYAVAAYSPGAQSNKINAMLVPEPVITDRSTAVWSNEYYRGPTAPGDYTYESYIVVGTMQEVLDTIPQLLALVPPPPLLPIGYVDSTSSCTALVGWACRKDSTNEIMQVKYYADGFEGQGTLIGQTNANLNGEPAIGRACGGNSNHRYSLPIPESIKDGAPHNVYAYAVDPVNNTEGYLWNNYTTVNCAAPSSTPTPTPSPPNGIICGPIDIDGNDKLNIIDLSAFAKVYTKTCSDTPPTSGCGAKDSNHDGKVDILDLSNFAKKYIKPSCS